MDIRILHEAIAVVAPIDGVYVEDAADKATWLVNFLPEATDQEKAAAADVLANFVWPPEPPTIEETKIEVGELVAAGDFGEAISKLLAALR